MTKKFRWVFFISYKARSHGILENLAQAEPISAILARVVLTAIIVVSRVFLLQCRRKVFSGFHRQNIARS